MSVIFRGPGFEDGYIELVNAAYMIPVIPIAENDELSVNGEVKVYEGDPIAVYHGETEVGTISNSGSFSREFTAASADNEVSLRATGACEHRLGYLEITKA